MKDEKSGPPGAAGAKPPAAPASVKPLPPAGPTRLRSRHAGVLASFLLFVALPILLAFFYLYVIAKDQFASRMGFSVRREEMSSAVELLGGLSSLSGSSSSSDTDVLFEFIRSQPMVELIDARLDLRRVYAVGGDPVFALSQDATIEDLTAYWSRMVKVFYDSGSGLIELRVQAFSADEAHAVATAIFDESSKMINELSSIARQDATRYAREELDRAVGRLTAARQSLTEFRARTRIVDPQADIQGRMELLTALEGQLVEALIDLDILRETTRETDQRILQAERRVAVLEERIATERARFGVGDVGPEGDEAYASLVSEFERLSVDVEFAQQAYLAALGSYDTAVAEAQRQSRYLAAYVEPTLAERAEYPQRLVLLALIAMFSIIIWSIGILVYYSIRDRR